MLLALATTRYRPPRSLPAFAKSFSLGPGGFHLFTLSGNLQNPSEPWCMIIAEASQLREES